MPQSARKRRNIGSNLYLAQGVDANLLEMPGNLLGDSLDYDESYYGGSGSTGPADPNPRPDRGPPHPQRGSDRTDRKLFHTTIDVRQCALRDLSYWIELDQDDAANSPIQGISGPGCSC
jgi:hypothetical protein